MCLSQRRRLGNEDHRKGGLARRERIRAEARSFETRATRFEEIVRAVLSRFGRRVGANPISARPCICANDGKIPGM